jgi:hypothetical protein
MIDENAKKIIEENPVALATVDNENKPNVIAVAYVKVIEDKIVVTDNFMKTSVANILVNPNVSLAVWDKDWNGYKITGQATYYTGGKWKEIVETLPENKDFSAKGAVVVSVESIKDLG